MSQPQLQEIISAALDLRDRLAESNLLRVPFADADSVRTSGCESELKSYGVVPMTEERLYAERIQVATQLASLLDPRRPCEDILETAAEIRNRAWGNVVSFSPKVFIDLTRLCRDRCAYCTFVRNPLSAVAASRGYRIRYSPGGKRADDDKGGSGLERRISDNRRSEPYLLPEEVLSIAEAGRKAGCREALFTLGDRPEDRYPVARDFLARMGCDSTSQYVYECAGLVLKETGLLPHLNPGVMTGAELASYKEVAASCGMMLESTSLRLFADPSGPHYNCPDKHPAVRIDTIEAAGSEKVPFTTGLLIGIGESLESRADTLVVLSALALRHGHIQEVIVQNFRSKPAIPMRDHPEPSMEEMARTVALARVLLPDEVAVQAPPNLAPGSFGDLLDAGLSDWGGVSPVTLDHVNPEAIWPRISELRQVTESHGFELRARLCVYPSFATKGGWLSDEVSAYVEEASDGNGWAAPDGALAEELGVRPESESVIR